MSLFNLCVWVSVILIPYVIVWCLYELMCFQHPLCDCVYYHHDVIVTSLLLCVCVGGWVWVGVWVCV